MQKLGTTVKPRAAVKGDGRLCVQTNFNDAWITCGLLFVADDFSRKRLAQDACYPSIRRMKAEQTPTAI
jgi:hypothetical protein